MRKIHINYKSVAETLNAKLKPYRNTFLTRSQIEDLVRESIPYGAISAVVTEMHRDGTLVKQHNRYWLSKNPIYYKRIQNWVENIRYKATEYKAGRKDLKTVNCKSVNRFLSKFETDQLVKFLKPVLKQHKLKLFLQTGINYDAIEQLPEEIQNNILKYKEV